tara:strand:- start:2630 stop:5593 length:2964 start_codon:yes stop_codon:yes gene_type:complete
MGEQVFKSPGVYSQEIDLSFTGPKEPFGTPAGAVGTAAKGPAFVPVTLASFKDFVDTFGKVDGKSFGAYAIQEWLRNAQSAVFVRVLGAGDGKQRESSASDSTSNNGRVNNAGFVVGGGTTLETNLNDQLNRNRDTAGPAAEADGRGRVYFLGALHSESAGSTYFSDAGKQESTHAVAVVRGVLFAASGTLLQLSASASGTLVAGDADADYSNITGTVNLTNSTFVMHVSGQVGTETDYPRFVTASFDTSQANYFGKVFNRNPLALKDHGYMLYESFDISNILAVVTGTTVVESSGTSDDKADIAFMLSGATAHNAGTSNVPNYENYEDRFTTPTSPYVMSQKFGGVEQDLFYVESISDGVYANDKYKISIANIKRSTSDETDFGTFTLLVRDFSDTDDNPIILEQFANLNLDRLSSNYVARRIGDKKVKFNFDQLEGAQKLLVEGEYDNVSRLIRVVPSALLKDGNTNETALPIGFRGIKHLVTSGSADLQANLLAVAVVESHGDSSTANFNELMSGAFQPPVPMRKDLTIGTSTKQEANKKLYWGIQFNRPVNINDLNKGNKQENIAAYTRYFGNENLTSIQAPLTASDTFCNNKFSLENIQVITSSGGGPADQNRLTEWAYKRDGSVINTGGTRSFDLTKDLNKNSNVAKFTFILQGGFDGTNIFNTEFNELQEGAAIKEADISALQVKGATIGSYRRAIDIMTNPDDVDVSLLVVPGQTEPLITDYAIEKTEERFDAMYIMDPRLLDSNKNKVTGSSQNISVSETANDHATRGINSNFAASYFPGTTLFDSVNNRLVDVPSSVSVLGAFGFNDKVAQPWFAAAGFNRGALNNVVGTRVSLSLTDRDALQNVNLNPIATFTGKGAVIFGQKTLQQKQSALDRVNVRRLLIELRRAVRNVSNLILFEPNRTATLQRFSNLINPILERIKAQAGVERFKVVIDETTTSPADVENNIIRGKIFVQVTKTIEVIALDFIVTNQGGASF